MDITVSYSQTKHKDSVVVPASGKYKDPSLLRTIFIGRNYREEWITPVRIPILNLKNELGGFTIVDSGGGRQTNNLRLKDRQGNEWILRSVDKDIEKSLLPPLRNTMVEILMQDLQSAIHPYAALTIPVLAEAVGITVSKPTVFFVPDDPALEEYRSIFANTVCLLEEREPTPDQSETKSTNTVFEKLFTESDHRLLQKKILKARLLDMLIADWDRHEDQWRWGINDSSGINYYYPIPRDRDFAYFNSDGLFIKFASWISLPQMKGFTKKATGLKRLNAKVLDLDLRWLNELSAADWKAEISMLQKNLSDSIINQAVQRIPAEIYASSGNKLVNKLITRRNGLMKYAMNYYHFLARHPVIFGTDDQELIRISSCDSGICVTVQGNKNNQIIYSRKFNPRETKRIFVKGQDGNDQFIVDENVSSSIKLYLEGGDGNDLYSVKGNIKTKIEDDNKVSGKSVLVHK